MLVGTLLKKDVRRPVYVFRGRDKRKMDLHIRPTRPDANRYALSTAQLLACGFMMDIL